MAEHDARPGRSCSVSYRYGAEALRRCAEIEAETLYVAGVRIDYDSPAWQAAFLANWPAGSDAHASYYDRICSGPRYAPGQAMRPALRMQGAGLTV